MLLVGLLLAALSTAPYVRASLSPPPGHAFVGFFWFVDDSYNYLSFVQQAEAGAVLFHNKLVLEDHPAVAVQPGMVDGGRAVARCSGGTRSSPIACSASPRWPRSSLGIDRWLAGAGLPASHRVPALLLVTTGAGLGGIRLLLGAADRSAAST